VGGGKGDPSTPSFSRRICNSIMRVDLYLYLHICLHLTIRAILADNLHYFVRGAHRCTLPESLLISRVAWSLKLHQTAGSIACI